MNAAAAATALCIAAAAAAAAAVANTREFGKLCTRPARRGAIRSPPNEMSMNKLMG